MLSKLLILLSGFFLFSTSYAEKKITIQIELDSTVLPISVTVWGFYGNQTYPIDSINATDTKQNIILKGNTLYKGFYRIQIGNKMFYDFIAVPGQSVFFQYTSDENGMVLATTDEDNRLLMQLKKNIHEINQSIKLIGAIQSEDTFITNNSIRSVLQLKMQKNQMIREYQKKFLENTFKLLSDFIIEPIDENGKESGIIYLSNLHLNDSSSVHTNYLPGKLIDYIAFYHQPNEEGFKNGLKEVFEACKDNSYTRQYCLYFYLQLFQKVGPDAVFRFLAENYYLNESCDNSALPDKETETSIQRLLQMLPGNKIDPLVLISDDKKAVETQKLAAKNKQILYLFWSPDCHFCEELILELQSKYTILRKQKTEIISFAITEDEKEWLSKSEKFKWTNTSDLKGWKSDIVKNWGINKTPLLILTDSNNIILKYDFYYEDLFNEKQ